MLGALDIEYYLYIKYHLHRTQSCIEIISAKYWLYRLLSCLLRLSMLDGRTDSKVFVRLLSRLMWIAMLHWRTDSKAVVQAMIHWSIVVLSLWSCYLLPTASKIRKFFTYIVQGLQLSGWYLCLISHFVHHFCGSRQWKFAKNLKCVFVFQNPIQSSSLCQA